jgi:hypothetical protein
MGSTTVVHGVAGQPVSRLIYGMEFDLRIVHGVGSQPMSRSIYGEEDDRFPQQRAGII